MYLSVGQVTGIIGVFVLLLLLLLCPATRYPLAHTTGLTTS